MKSIRRLATEKKIREYWSERLYAFNDSHFDSAEELKEENLCFACGCDDVKCERAHIIAKCEGGSDNESNLHMLCPTCHKNSEYLTLNDYFLWIKSRTMFDMLIARSSRMGLNVMTYFKFN